MINEHRVLLIIRQLRDKMLLRIFHNEMENKINSII